MDAERERYHKRAPAPHWSSFDSTQVNSVLATAIPTSILDLATVSGAISTYFAQFTTDIPSWQSGLPPGVKTYFSQEALTASSLSSENLAAQITPGIKTVVKTKYVAATPTAPPAASTSSASRGSGENDGGGLSTGAKAGIGAGVGGGVLILIIAFIVYCLTKRNKDKKRKRDQEEREKATWTRPSGLENGTLDPTPFAPSQPRTAPFSPSGFDQMHDQNPGQGQAQAQGYGQFSPQAAYFPSMPGEKQEYAPAPPSPTNQTQQSTKPGEYMPYNPLGQHPPTPYEQPHQPQSHTQTQLQLQLQGQPQPQIQPHEIDTPFRTSQTSPISATGGTNTNTSTGRTSGAMLQPFLNQTGNGSNPPSAVEMEGSSSRPISTANSPISELEGLSWRGSGGGGGGGGMVGSGSGMGQSAAAGGGAGREGGEGGVYEMWVPLDQKNSGR